MNTCPPEAKKGQLFVGIHDQRTNGMAFRRQFQTQLLGKRAFACKKPLQLGLLTFNTFTPLCAPRR
jgi:hypothetical protein